jgi:hypothetical protein
MGGDISVNYFKELKRKTSGFLNCKKNYFDFDDPVVVKRILEEHFFVALSEGD